MDRTDFLSEMESCLPHLRRYALSLTASQPDADDLVQDTMVRAIARKSGFTEGTDLRRWMFTIMHNIHIDGWRRKKRRGPHVSYEEGDRVDRAQPSQIHLPELIDTERALGRLNGVEREIVDMVVLQGKRYEDTAEQLGVALGTVKSRLSRARTRLRATLGEG